ncbi:MAG: PD-(D/E)XK nuclease family protein [Verrucomicrobia bacterium]|nr:PD-(D/E)XK nuclease family protein [Verrucomicrobiota bacterium]
MQNPFVQLRKYQQGLSDPQENRATETLAACLVFSAEARREFLIFLFGGKRRFEIGDMAAYVVSTQQQTADGSWVDLLIEKDGEENIVVEVKVKDEERGDQIQKYRDWLEKTKKGNHYVFNLVKQHEPAFDIKKHGGEQHHTWRELYDHLSRVKKQELETTDASLIEHFCNYLEVEGIVSTWKPNEILAYGPGLVARRAIVNLFEQVARRLDELGLDYETKIMMPETEWARLEIGRTSWKAIFGEKGYLNKVYAFYMMQDVWSAKADGFSFEIQLWNRWHRCDWDVTEPKLSQWLKRLKQEGFERCAELRGNKPLKADIDGYKFSERPAQISAFSSDVAVQLISTVQIETMTSDALVDEVYQRVLLYCNIVSQLR